MNKFFVTGASGLLSLNLFIKKNKTCEFTGSLNNKQIKIDIDNLSLLKIDLFNKNELLNILIKLKPDYLIHNAALTNLELCEIDKNLCSRVNYDLTCICTDICKDLGIKLIFLSSDQIYSGLKYSYSEDDQTSPINNYGLSKVKSEDYIMNKLTNFIIIRTNFFGWGPSYRKSFSDRILLKSEEILKELNDVHFNPIYAGTLIELIMKLIEKNSMGIFNISSDQHYTKYELAKKILNYFNSNNELKPIYLNDLPKILSRPKSMVLENSKLKKEINLSKLDISNCLSNLKLDLDNGFAKKIQGL